jgi:hypothetical protein
VPVQLAGVEDTNFAQRPPEGAAPHCQREASRIGMKVRTPARQPAGRVGPEPETGLLADRDDPQ